MDKFKRYIWRAFAINVVFVFFSYFALIYLVHIPDIKNWDMLFVFLPILIIAISSETMTKKAELRSFRVRPYNILGFCIKCAVYILVQIGFRRLVIDPLFFVILAIISALILTSFLFEWIMLKKLSKRGE
ncbi:MAG: hypothetical protein LBP26_01385 [Clostridiales bacterium]|jgi:hypothetical protein|nr:hypothetical protein [Clostridiales bacterium]